MSTSASANTLSSAKIARFIYSLLCYVLSVASLIYFILFVNDLVLSKTVNSVTTNQTTIAAILINIFALSLFAIQHSVMARQHFKHWLTQYIHPDMERATYCLATAAVIFLMAYLWVPFGGTIWQVESDSIANIIRGVAFFGWTFLLAASFQLDHFELFGLKQTFLPLIGKEMQDTHFRTPGIYNLVRHPIQTGVLIGMWFVPTATASHLFFATGITIYIFIGLYFEEQSLIRSFGDDYRNYKKRVKKLIPFII